MASQQAEATGNTENKLCTTCSKLPPSDKAHPKCSGCHTMPYCSKECQKADWKSHKKTCTFKKRESGSDDPLNSRFRGIVSIGPVTTVGEVLQAKANGTPADFQTHMCCPTPKELWERCEGLLNAGDEKKKGEKTKSGEKSQKNGEDQK